MADLHRIVVIGAGGFVGGAVVRSAREKGIEVLPLHAPRVESVPLDGALSAARDHRDLVASLAARMPGAGVVVNAAGLAEATGHDEGALLAANCASPAIVAAACRERGLPLLHISSAAVQGRMTLDDSERHAPFSAYSRSKAAGERAVRAEAPDAVLYRPPGVHDPSRSVTRTLARIARSRLSSVAGPGTLPTAQTLLANVGDACVFLASRIEDAPRIVTHPSDGLTTSELLTALGGRPPARVPRRAARLAVDGARLAGRASPMLAGHARRLEILWFGQEQESSWLTRAGWRPPAGRREWDDLGRDLRAAALEQEEA